MRKLSIWQEQLSNGQFQYKETLETVQLVSDCENSLSLEEAWRIEDSFSGYAGRTYSAVQETAQALKNLSGSAVVKSVIQEIHNSFQQDRFPKDRTGEAGVRDSLNALAFMELVKRPSQRREGYSFTPLGWAYIRGSEPDDEMFIQKLNE